MNDLSTLIPVLAAIVVATASITVPFLTFRFATRQEYLRWHRDRRADLYIDLLAEAYAEQQWLELRMADDQIREQVQAKYPDTRMAPAKRAKLGARCNAFASTEVMKHFNAMQQLGANAMLPLVNPADDITTKIQLATTFEALNKAIRDELGTDGQKILKQRR